MASAGLNVRICVCSRRCSRIRYSRFLSSSSLISSFCGVHILRESSDTVKFGQSSPAQDRIDEHVVLSELSDLLNISQTSNYRRFVDKPIETRRSDREADYYLSPSDKLRGVFLHTRKGTAAVESALTAVGVDLTIDTVAEVLNWGNLSGGAMVSFFWWAMKQPQITHTLQTYHIILRALGRRKFFDFMAEILRQMTKAEVKPSSETLTIVMDSFAKARQVKKAIHFFENLEEFGSMCDTDSLNVLLLCLCRRAHVRTASSFLVKMKDRISISSTTYNIILEGWSKLGKTGQLRRNLEAMAAQGLEYSSNTFSSLIEGLGRAGNVNGATEVFSKLESRGCHPDAVIYNAMIRNFISVGDIDQCVYYYKVMTQRNCEPKVETYTHLVGALIKARRVADALDIFDEMLARGIIPSPGAVTTFILPLCSFGPPYAAMMIYKKAKKLGCKISPKAYKILLMRLSRFGKCGMILKLWEEMLADGHSSDAEVYTHVINGFCNIGQLSNAVFIMEEALRKGYCPDKFVYSKLSNKLLNAGKVEVAYKLSLKVKSARLHQNARRYWRANGWHF